MSPRQSHRLRANPASEPSVVIVFRIRERPAENRTPTSPQRHCRPAAGSRQQSPVRYLAIDLGDKRTGLALGDDRSRLVSPLDVLAVPIARGDGRELLEAIRRSAEKHLGPADELVIGLPINMDGSEGPRARIVRAFAARLEQATDRPVHFQDERLTSADAEWTLAGSGLTHDQKKARRDALAAAAILRDFLEAHPTPDPPDSSEQSR